MSYCTALNTMKEADRLLHQAYHDKAYGFPIDTDEELFCRLILEINQAGLSWTTILRKQEGFRKAYHQFNIGKVARYSEKDIERLMNTEAIIRNRLKILAAIANAKAILEIQASHGSFRNWLDAQGKMPKDQWVKLFKKTFRFTGGEIVNEFLMSAGYLPGAHDETCPVYKKVIRAKPSWSRK